MVARSVFHVGVPIELIGHPVRKGFHVVERGHGLRVPAVLGIGQDQRVAMVHNVELSRLTVARPEMSDGIPQKLQGLLIAIGCAGSEAEASPAFLIKNSQGNRACRGVETESLTVFPEGADMPPRISSTRSQSVLSRVGL